MAFSQSILNISYPLITLFLERIQAITPASLDIEDAKPIYNPYIKQVSVQLYKQVVKLILWCNKCSIYQHDFLNHCSWWEVVWFHPLSVCPSVCVQFFSEIPHQIFMIFYMKKGIHNQKKLRELYSQENSHSIFGEKEPKICQKQAFSYFLKKLINFTAIALE